MNARASTLRASAGIALSQYLARAVVLVRGVVAASALGPLGFGGWNALNLILDYGYFAPAGALQGLDLKLPASVTRADAPGARAEMGGAWAVTLLGAIGFSALVLVLPGLGARELTATFGRGAAALMLAAAVLQLAVLYLASALRAHGRFGAVSLWQSLQALIGGGVGIALVWPLGVWGLIDGWILGTLVAIAGMWRAAPEAPLRPGALAAGGALVRAGLPIFSFYALSLVLRSTDRLAFVHFGQPAALGHYSLGLMASGLVLYAPEAVGFVLFPRLAAAAAGARDPGRTRDEMLRAHRALTVALPLPIALAAVWAGPVVGWLLPAYATGVGALRLLAVASLLFSVSTLPGYFLLAGGFNRRLLAVGSLAVLVNGALVFAVVARDPRPASVAAAALAGYAAFAAGLVGAAAFALFGAAGERWRFGFASFLPGAWTGAVTLAACAAIGGETARAALLRSGAVIVLAVPLVAALARGAGLLAFTRGVLAARRT